MSNSAKVPSEHPTFVLCKTIEEAQRLSQNRIASFIDAQAAIKIAALNRAAKTKEAKPMKKEVVQALSEWLIRTTEKEIASSGELAALPLIAATLLNYSSEDVIEV